MLLALKLTDDLLSIFDDDFKKYADDNKVDDNMKNVWRKYDSISFRMRGSPDDVKWCLTEKVHGANFAIITNGKEFIAARRTSLLKWSDDFFPGWQNVVENNKKNVLNALKLVQETIDSTINVICIYGEIFGGLFENKDASYRPRIGVRHVQKDIYYSPKLHFYAFDIVIKNGIKIEFSKTLNILKQSNFLYCEPLFIGTLKECKAYSSEHLKDFISTIPNKLGLPQPNDQITGKIIKNIAEGYVFRKLNNEHAMFKKKSPKFREIIRDQRKNVIKIKLTPQQLKEKALRNKAKKELKGSLNKNDKQLSLNEAKNKFLNEFGLNDKNKELFDLVEFCVNENRFQSVMSKIGILTKKNMNKMKGMYIGDVWQELLREKSDQMKIVCKDKKKKGLLKKFCAKCVEEFFVPKIKGL